MRVIDAVRETSYWLPHGVYYPHQHSVDTPVCLPPRRRSYLVLLRAGITLFVSHLETSCRGSFGLSQCHSGFWPLPSHISGAASKEVRSPNVIWQGKSRTVLAAISTITLSWSNMIYSAFTVPARCRNLFAWEHGIINMITEADRKVMYECIE